MTGEKEWLFGPASYLGLPQTDPGNKAQRLTHLLKTHKPVGLKTEKKNTYEGGPKEKEEGPIQKWRSLVA